MKDPDKIYLGRYNHSSSTVVDARKINKKSYESSRSQLIYYKKCLEIIENFRSRKSLNSIIDIGGWGGGFVARTQMEEKFCLDARPAEEPAPGVEFIIEDFLTWKPDRKYDFTSCMQVLEHIKDEDVETFAQKLFTLSPHVLISVPYQWPKGRCRYHLQDPVDEEKLLAWTKKSPTLSLIVREWGNARRLISYYRVF